MIGVGRLCTSLNDCGGRGYVVAPMSACFSAWPGIRYFCALASVCTYVCRAMNTGGLSAALFPKRGEDVSAARHYDAGCSFPIRARPMTNLGPTVGQLSVRIPQEVGQHVLPMFASSSRRSRNGKCFRFVLTLRDARTLAVLANPASPRQDRCSRAEREIHSYSEPRFRAGRFRGIVLPGALFCYFVWVYLSACI